MAYITEMQKSRELSLSNASASTSRTYNLFDYVDAEQALSALAAYIPVSVYVGNTLCVLPEFEITPVFSDPDRTLHTGTVTWKSADIASGGSNDPEAQDPKEPEDDTNFSFSFSSITDVLQNSIDNGEGGTGRYLPNGQSGRLTTSTINQQHPDLPPEGVQINSPIATITAKTVISGYVASNAWFKARMDQVWTTNNATWRGLPNNCVMFTGMDGTLRSDGHWSITYNFEYRPPTTGKKFAYWVAKDTEPSSLTLQSHSGWSHYDASYFQVKQTIPDGSYEKTVRSLSSVEVHHIYPESDFTQLGMVGV